MSGAASSSKLFEPIRVGLSALQHRIALAPLTRFRADGEHVPHSYVKDYYTQRSAVPGTLLITEATFISPEASGYGNAPGIWSEKQIAGWKNVVESVHGAGGKIFLQLWALGRTASPDVKKKENTGDLVSASAIPMQEGAPVPRALTEEEIETYVKQYAQAAKNAVHGAGFDGVEIHGANGYLVDQFIQDTSNQRTDKWGGSIENRSRFAVEIAKAVTEAVGGDRTAIRLSPWSSFQGMKMTEPVPQFLNVLEQLKPLNLAYIHLVESRVNGSSDGAEGEPNDPLLDFWNNASPVLLAGGFSPETARETVDKKYKNKDIVIVFGRHFIPNPDLVFRIKNNIELTKYDRSLFYAAEQTKGYIDYPFSEEYTKTVKAQA